ncbi:MAG: hypothetical protein KGL39_44745 [Patescibacteria group bacterium]|nr:hypothetical protein [Patescibacteria group bacterium]
MASAMKVVEVYTGPSPAGASIPDVGPNSFYSVTRWDNAIPGASVMVPSLLAMITPYIGQRIGFWQGLALAMQLMSLFAPKQ